MTASKVTCPHCRSADLNVIEDWSGFSMSFPSESYTVGPDGVTITGEGWLHEGEPTGRYVWRCNDCGHCWRIRRAVVVDNYGEARHL